jgi:hypothetical protein
MAGRSNQSATGTIMPLADKYQHYYDLNELLSRDAEIIPAPIIEQSDAYQELAEALARLAQPLPDGSDSPFTSQSELSGEGILMNVILYYFQLVKHQLNLTPTQFLINWYRTIGVAKAAAEYPVIELRITRTQEAIANSIYPFIPIGTQIFSSFDPSDYVVITSEVEFQGSEAEIVVPARYSQLGALPSSIRVNEFNQIPRFLSAHISSISGTGAVLAQGSSATTVEGILLQARRRIQSPGGRAIVPRDYVELAREGGATKAGIFPRLRWMEEGGASLFDEDVVTVAVYPERVVSTVAELLSTASGYNSGVEVRAARVVPINGEVVVRIDPSLLDGDAQELAARSIYNSLNPPHGYFGDLNFPTSLAIALQSDNRQFFVDGGRMKLRHAITLQPFEELEIMPWDLFEIQADIQFVWERFGTRR